VRQVIRRIAQRCVIYLGWLLLTGSLAVAGDPMPRLEHHHYVLDGEKIHYVSAGAKDKPSLIFIHGTPGSWDAFGHLLQIPQWTQNYHLISVDRPGFGASREAGIQDSLEAQSYWLQPLLALNHADQKPVLIGHSLGGTIGMRMAVDLGDQISGLVAIAAPVNPRLGTRWYHCLVNFRLINWLLPAGLKAANKEMLPLSAGLQRLSDDLVRLNVPTLIIQGEDDLIVSAKNVAYAEAHIDASNLSIRRVDDVGHFILWEQPGFIVNEIEVFVRANLHPSPAL